MTKLSDLPLQEQARMESAAAWWMRLQENPALEFSPEFLDWSSEPLNSKAFQGVESGWAQLEAFAASPDIVDVRRAALGRIRQLGIKRLLPRRVAHWAAAATVLLFGASGVAFYMLSGPQTFYTAVGERRLVSLPDGSLVSMDSDTKLEVEYTKSGRSLVLDRGRARFDVAHDTKRPFAVTAGDETVVAVGTAFDVERLTSKVLVTLIQGHVVVKDVSKQRETSAPLKTLSLSAGQMLTAAGSAPPAVAPANLQTAAAWEAGHLIFKDETLEEAVERVNRYSDQPITLDPSVAGIRISGVFNAGDVGSFVSAVTSLLPVQATTTTDEKIVLQKRS